MYHTNRFLTQIHECGRYVRSSNPHHRRLAVILLANVVELALRRQADHLLCYEGVLFRDLPPVTSKRKHRISREYACLVEYVAERKRIRQSEVPLLMYAHDVRNRCYHEGDDGELDTRLAIRLYTRFIKSYFPKWTNGYGWTSIPRFGETSLSTLHQDDRGDRVIAEFGLNWEDAKEPARWSAFLNRELPRGKGGTVQLVKQKVLDHLRAIDENCEFIEENQTIGLVEVVGSRFDRITSVFHERFTKKLKFVTPVIAIKLYFIFVGRLEGTIYDLGDWERREREFANAVNSEDLFTLPITPERVGELRQQAHQLKPGAVSKAVRFFSDVQAETGRFAMAVHELACDIDREIDFQVDYARGK